MIKITRKSRLVKVAAATAAVGSIATIGLVGSTPTQADPKQYAALVGVGSDTTQEVMNALSGHSSGINFKEVQSLATSGRRQFISFDATTPGGDITVPECIITRTGGPAFERPNGSTAGRAALSRTIDNQKFQDKGRFCNPAGGGFSVSTSVDFARSSSGPGTLGTGTPPNQLVYVPFARDALSYAYNTGATGAVDIMTRQQLQNLYDGDSTSSEVVTFPNGVRVLPCGIQVGSGTYGSWNSSIGQPNPSGSTTSPEEIDATSTCRDLARLNNIGDADGRLQEHNGEQLEAIGIAARAANIADQVIVGFSASQFIARSNGRGEPVPPATVFMGGISNNSLTATPGANCGFPVVGGVAQLTFYSCGSFGRQVFNVFAWRTLFRDARAPGAAVFVEGPSVGNFDIKELFTTPGAGICDAEFAPTIVSSGFLVDTACGTTNQRSNLVPNPS